MTFQGQSVLSCVWGVTHSAASSQSQAHSAGIRERLAPPHRVRFRVLSFVVPKPRTQVPEAGERSENSQ